MRENKLKHLPLVSVYITTKNRPEMLQRAIKSVLQQTYLNVEIIVSDDGSTDETPDVMAKLIEQNDNIVYLRSDISKGACHARNKAIRQAKGVYVTGLDDDDRFTPVRIADFVNAYSDNVSFLFSLNYHYDGEKYSPSHYYNRIVTKDDIFRRNYIGNQIFVKKQTLVDNDIFFDEAFPAWQDYDFFTNLLCHVGSAKRVYSRSYITHTDHEKNRITNPKRILAGYRLYYKKYVQYMSKSQRVSLAVNLMVLSGKPVPVTLKKLCVKYGRVWDLYRILKNGK
jgi:glycosyltransferase involved in cell wall biosynthesis